MENGRSRRGSYQRGHASTVYEENVFVFGGHTCDKVVNDIYKVSLVSPHSFQLVCHLPEARKFHAWCTAFR